MPESIVMVERNVVRGLMQLIALISAETTLLILLLWLSWSIKVRLDFQLSHSHTLLVSMKENYLLSHHHLKYMSKHTTQVAARWNCMTTSSMIFSRHFSHMRLFTKTRNGEGRSNRSFWDVRGALRVHLLEQRGEVLLNSDVKFIREWWKKGTLSSMTSGSRKLPYAVE